MTWWSLSHKNILKMFFLSHISIEALSNFLKLLLREGSLNQTHPWAVVGNSDAAGQLGHSLLLPVYNSTFWSQTYFSFSTQRSNSALV